MKLLHSPTVASEPGEVATAGTSFLVDPDKAGRALKEICPRGNNKVVIYISLYHDKCLLFMLELY